MSSNFNLRSLLCLCLVSALHIAIFAVLPPLKESVTKNIGAPIYLQYVSVMRPEPQPQQHLEDAVKPLRPASIRASIIESIPEKNSIDQPPKPDIDALRKIAVQHAQSSERSPIELQREKNQPDQRLEARIEKGAKEAVHTDCRTSYAQTGLFAPLFIAADLLRDKGCRF